MKNQLPLLLATLAAALPTNAQTLPEGYVDSAEALPASISHSLILTGTHAGAEVRFDGINLSLHEASAQRSLLTFPAPVFGSLLVQVDDTQLLFGESSGGGLWLVPLNAPMPTQPLAYVQYSYDAAMLTPTLAVVSARTGGFTAPDNDLILVDLQAGTRQPLASIPGASGPVEISSGLYYATASAAYPTPPGQTSVLHFPTAVVLQAIGSGQVLGPANAQVVFSGLDSASDLAIDQDGDLLFVDWYQNTIGEIDDVGGPSPLRRTLLDYGAGTGALTIQFLPPGSLAAFEPFQHDGGVLHLFESDFVSLSTTRKIHTRAADLTASPAGPIPAGPFLLEVTGGPANGSGLIALGLANLGSAIPVEVLGFEQPLFWQSALLQTQATYFVNFDAGGAATLPLVNPGFPQPRNVLVQAAFVDAGATAIGATEARVVPLSQ